MRPDEIIPLMSADLMTMRYIHNNENVVFLGPPGVGKTHLSIALGMRSIMSDIPAYYISAMKLVQTLKRDYDLCKRSSKFTHFRPFNGSTLCSFI
jgi:DNA replication protein DnaC